LVEELCAGEVVGGLIDISNFDPSPRKISFEPDKINKLLGISVSKDDMIKLLLPLGFTFEKDLIVVPSFRADVVRMADIAEEVARMYGYDKIPTTMLKGEMTQGRLTTEQKFEFELSEACRAVGLYEVQTYSFISPKQYDKIRMPADSSLRASIVITNPLSEDMSIMRTTSLPSMLEVVARNYNFRNAYANLFELSAIYLPELINGKADATTLPKENKILTIACYGKTGFYELKGLLEVIFQSIGINSVLYESDRQNPAYHPGRCAKVFLNSTYLGTFGQIHPQVMKNFGIDLQVYSAELSFETLLASVSSERVYQPVPKFPAISRDLAVVCDKEVPAQSIEECIKKNAGKLLEQISLFDVYEGTQIPNGKKSIAYSLTFRVPERTLTDEEADNALRKALKALSFEFGAELRR
ncbi:MAG: phenylalanine--tRNA ligase subunit beta, partial [Clostridiales bacterium]|nr:phenylalanine--tRNA ligase subunit beta [Clostridiales bacterium]